MENLQACAEALDAFHKMRDQLQPIFDDLSLKNQVSKRSYKFTLNKVTVSVRPELMLSSDSGYSNCGFVKLYFGKTCPLSKSIGENMALLGKYYFDEFRKIYFKREKLYGDRCFCRQNLLCA